MGRKRKGGTVQQFTPKQENTSTPDPQLMAAMRHLVDFKFSHELDPERWREQLIKPVSYIVAGNGVFTFRKNAVVEVLTETSKHKIPALPEMRPGTWLKFPRIPFEILGQIISFFRVIAEYISAEAYVQVWMKNETGEFIAHVPEQEVSGGRVEHKGVLELKDHTLLLEMHSHGKSMDAFWSGTDNSDESRAGGMRLYGVAGHVLKAVPSFKFRCGTGFSEWVDLRPADVFEIPDESVTVSVPMAEVLAGGAKLEVDPFAEATYPAEWEEKITERKIEVRGFIGSGDTEHNGNRVQRLPGYEHLDRLNGDGDAFDRAEMRSDKHDDEDSVLAKAAGILYEGEKLFRSESGIYYVIGKNGSKFTPQEQQTLDALWRMGVREG